VGRGLDATDWLLTIASPKCRSTWADSLVTCMAVWGPSRAVGVLREQDLYAAPPLRAIPVPGRPSRRGGSLLSMAADEAHQVTRCCIQEHCIDICHSRQVTWCYIHKPSNSGEVQSIVLPPRWTARAQTRLALESVDVPH
jgi:hypothetical protein